MTTADRLQEIATLSALLPQLNGHTDPEEKLRQEVISRLTVLINQK